MIRRRATSAHQGPSAQIPTLHMPALRATCQVTTSRPAATEIAQRLHARLVRATTTAIRVLRVCRAFPASMHLLDQLGHVRTLSAEPTRRTPTLAQQRRASLALRGRMYLLEARAHVLVCSAQLDQQTMISTHRRPVFLAQRVSTFHTMVQADHARSIRALLAQQTMTATL